MTITSTSNKITNLGNGVQTAFSFSFVGVADGDIVVIYTDPTGAATTLVEGLGPTQYQLVFNPVLPGNLWALGGTVNYNPNGIPIPNGSTLTITRQLPQTQNFSITNQSSYGAYLRATEQALDYQMMVTQQVSEAQGRALVVPLVDANPPAPLPPAAQRANAFLAFDSQGNPMAAALTSQSGLISTAMIPVTSASSIPNARTALGLGNMATLNLGQGLQNVAGAASVLFTAVTLGVNTTVTAANHLQKLKVTGPVVLTLNRAQTYFNGFGFWVENLLGGGNVTIAVDPNDQIENGAAGVSVILPPGYNGFIATNAAPSGTWWLETSWNGAQGQPFNLVGAAGSWSNLSIDVASPTTATCSVGSVVVTDGVLANAVIPTGGLDFGVVGAGGLDTGAIAQNSAYSVWAIYNPITRLARWMLSLQATANAQFMSTVPAGFKQFARLGTLLTNTTAATLRATRQRGREVRYQPGLIAGFATLPVIASGSAGNPAGPTWVGTSLAGFVPNNAASVDVLLSFGPNNSVVSAMAAPSNNYGAVDSANPPPISFSSGQTAGSGQNNGSSSSGIARFLGLNGTTSVFYASNNPSSHLFALGWEENI